MSKGRIAPVRPSIAKILKKQIGGFVREYEREVNRPTEPPKTAAAATCNSAGRPADSSARPGETRADASNAAIARFCRIGSVPSVSPRLFPGIIWR